MSKIDDLQKWIEEMIDEIMEHEPERIQRFVDDFQFKHRKLNKDKIAEKIVYGQARNSGLLGALTGFGGFIALPATIPIDIIKYLRVQAYTVCCLSYLYGYSLDRKDLKTDINLILSHSSFEEIKNFVCAEGKKEFKEDYVKKKAFDNLKSKKYYKDFITINMKKQAQGIGVRYAARIFIGIGGKAARDYALRDFPKILRGVIWRVGGRKIAEKSLQKSFSKAIPVLSSIAGGGMDWWMTNKAGKVAIEYYRNDGPDFLDAAYSIINS